MEQIHLNIHVARPIEQGLIMRPVVRIDPADVAHAIRILKFGGLGLHEKRECLAVSCRTVSPISLDWIPEFLETLFVRVAVLNYKCTDALRMLQGEAVADR